jgi:hypothetical protein
VRLGGIEPPTCGLKGRCSLAPRRLPLTTELQAHEYGPRIVVGCVAAVRPGCGRCSCKGVRSRGQPSIAAYTSSSSLARSESWKLSAR